LTFQCYKNDTERAVAAAASKATLGNSSDVALGGVWATQQIFAEQCFTNPDPKTKGGLINTAFVARDLMKVVDALGEDGLLRYIGSYLTCGDFPFQ
jgi:hypothetical protein